jgi:hypothetical protein
MLCSRTHLEKKYNQTLVDIYHRYLRKVISEILADTSVLTPTPASLHIASQETYFKHFCTARLLLRFPITTKNRTGELAKLSLQVWNLTNFRNDRAYKVKQHLLQDYSGKFQSTFYLRQYCIVMTLPESKMQQAKLI